MTPLRKARWFAAAITLATAFAWVLASNHCALAAMQSVVKDDHSCCHKEPPASPLPSTQCCGSFNIPIPEQAAAPVAHLHELKPAWIVVAEILPPAPAAVAPAERDTGPPRVATPVRVTLARCQPAHAPPFSVA